MRTKLLIAVFAGALGALGGWLIGRPPAPAGAEAPKHAGPSAVPKIALAPPPHPARTESDVPLSSIYTTAYHKGLRSLPRNRDETFTSICERLDERLHRLRFPTAFLVQSGTIYGAVGTTVNVLEGHAQNGVNLRSDLGPDSGWAVLYLGNRNDSITIISATISSGELKLNYRSSDGDDESARESVPHMYWIRLPKLTPGDVVLRMHDTVAKVDGLLVRTTVR